MAQGKRAEQMISRILIKWISHAGVGERRVTQLYAVELCPLGERLRNKFLSPPKVCEDMYNVDQYSERGGPYGFTMLCNMN